MVETGLIRRKPGLEPYALLAAIIVIVGQGCQTDLRLDERMYPCEQNADCPQESICDFSRPHGQKICVPVVYTAPDGRAYSRPVPEMLALGRYHTCVLTAGGRVACWGGDSDESKIEVPDDEYSYIDAYRDTTCAITTAGRLRCWGPLPQGVELPERSDFTSVHVGFKDAPYICAATGGGEMHCYGDADLMPPKLPMLAYEDVSLGETYWCVISEEQLVCQNPEQERNFQPFEGPFASVSVAFDYFCALRLNGGLACHGRPEEYELPQYSITYYDRVSVGLVATCAVDIDEQLECWSRADATPPAHLIEGQETFRDVKCGHFHCCGTTTDHRIHCWGSDAFANDGATVVPSEFR